MRVIVGAVTTLFSNHVVCRQLDCFGRICDGVVPAIELDESAVKTVEGCENVARALRGFGK